jgi:hypothetical protein
MYDNKEAEAPVSCALQHVITIGGNEVREYREDRTIHALAGGQYQIALPNSDSNKHSERASVQSPNPNECKYDRSQSLVVETFANF